MAHTKVTAELEIRALLGEAQQELNTFQTGLKKLWQNGEPPKNVLKAYEHLTQKLGTLQDLAQKGLVDETELASITTE